MLISVFKFFLQMMMLAPYLQFIPPFSWAVKSLINAREEVRTVAKTFSWEQPSWATSNIIKLFARYAVNSLPSSKNIWRTVTTTTFEILWTPTSRRSERKRVKPRNIFPVCMNNSLSRTGVVVFTRGWLLFTQKRNYWAFPEIFSLLEPTRLVAHCDGLLCI